METSFPSFNKKKALLIMKMARAVVVWFTAALLVAFLFAGDNEAAIAIVTAVMMFAFYPIFSSKMDKEFRRYGYRWFGANDEEMNK